MTILLENCFNRSFIQRYWELLYVLVERNLKVRYRGSILGVYWSLLNPLMITGLYTAIFGATFVTYYDNLIFNYILAAFTGLVVIEFFRASSNQAIVSVVNNGDLLNKIRLPVSIFPVSMVAANVFQFTVGAFPLLLMVTLYRSHNIFNIICLFLPILALIWVTLGISFLISALYVFFRDINHIFDLIIFILSIGSPIFYPAAIVPDSVKPILLLNPLLPIIESIRQISLSGELPDLFLIGQALLSSLIVLAFGWSIFRMWQPQFMDLL